MTIDKIESIEFKNKNTDEPIWKIDSDVISDYHIKTLENIPSYISATPYTVDLGDNLSERTMESIFDYISKKLNKVPTVEHKCHNCGATLEIDTNKHIFNCPYCESVYAIGTQNIYDFI